MHEIGEYLVSVTAAALICSIAQRLVTGGTAAAAVKMVCGLLMVLAVVRPLADPQYFNLQMIDPAFQESAQIAVDSGKEQAQKALRDGISRKVREYILDKAASVDAVLTVEVRLTQDAMPVPCGVTLRGSIAPYAKSVLSEYIEKELGVSTEAQIWIS